MSNPPADPTGRARIPKAMTIAGSDSGGGAGIQADLKTFAAFGVYGSSVLTAITAQNTRSVFAIAEVPEEVIAIQIDAVLEDIGADAIKTGMLSSATIVETVADRLEAWGLPLVVDPVMVAKSGDHLLQPSAVGAVKRALLPLATVVTPNAPEAEVLSGRSVTTVAEAREAAKAIADLGPNVVVVKGGHLPGDATDVVWDGDRLHELPVERIETTNTHGTGCTFASAITAGIALGQPPLPAIVAAKHYLTEAIRHSFAVGDGHSPVNHFWNIQFGTASAPGYGTTAGIQKAPSP